MSVIPLTIFFSLLLAGTFVVLFAREQRQRRLTSPERDSLLPLADELARLEPDDLARGQRVRRPRSTPDRPGACECREGRPPCPDCLRRRAEAADRERYF